MTPATSPTPAPTPALAPALIPTPAPIPERFRWWDIERVTELEAELFPGDTPWTAEMFWAELAAGHHYVVVRDRAGVPIGYAGLARHADGVAEVQTIGVDPAHRRRGLGRVLLTDLLLAAGPDRVLLDVRTDNTAALRLYEDMGFARIGRRRRYYQPSGADAYTMELQP